MGQQSELDRYGGRSISELCCDTTRFSSFSPSIRAQLRRVDLEGLVTEELAGFNKLTYLRCDIEPPG